MLQMGESAPWDDDKDNDAMILLVRAADKGLDTRMTMG